ncbi:MAG: hypothetical protein IJQ81_00595, partial [Oscillibacter sp.]|nr:hypothetical protein [Oscillibacter sp.]
VDGFKAWLTSQQSAIQVAYPLASPLTYTLTPAQLATLSGYNAIAADAGTLSVTYRADPALTLEALESNLTNAILSLGGNVP